MSISRKQAGVVLAATLACLFLAILLSAGLAASTLTAHRRMAEHLPRQQAAWLAESAASRAAAQLRRNADYSGEAWSISAAELNGMHAGKAIIAVAPDGDETDRRRVKIEAYYPDDPVQRTKITKEFVVQLGQTTNE
ncbi:MAG: hypothetical protein KY475_13445 [Planctomycetes bacterium]|nr:hypothetical protein [Planctomycetota bacterium]